MNLLIVIITFLSIFGIFNLMLTMALIRRVKMQGEMLAKISNHDQQPSLPAVGHKVIVENPVTTIRGTQITEASFPHGLLIAFFATDCDTCHEQLPRYLEQAQEFGRDRVLNVVHGDLSGSGLESLAEVGQVVNEPHFGVLGQALRIRAYPTLAVLDGDWKVIESCAGVDGLQRLAR